MNCVPLNTNDAEVIALVSESDNFYLALYPPESNHLDSLHELAQSHVVFLGYHSDSQLVACGAVKLMSDDGRYGELKRLFVKPRYRGLGISRLLMVELEAAAGQWQVPCLRLETGTRQPQALGLYRKLGYRERGPFGAYLPDPLSVFMEKNLDSAK